MRFVGDSSHEQKLFEATLQSENLNEWCSCYPRNTERKTECLIFHKHEILLAIHFCLRKPMYTYIIINQNLKVMIASYIYA